MSVVFDFKASLNDVVPVYPMLFPVDTERNEKSKLLMNDIGYVYLFVLTTQTEFSERCV